MLRKGASSLTSFNTAPSFLKEKGDDAVPQCLAAESFTSPLDLETFPRSRKEPEREESPTYFHWFICFERNVKRKVVFLPGGRELDQSHAQVRLKAIYPTECTVTWRQRATDEFMCIFTNSPRPQNCKSFATRQSFSEATPLRRTPQVRLGARLNVLWKKKKKKIENTTHSASRNQGRSNFSLLFHQKKRRRNP